MTLTYTLIAALVVMAVSLLGVITSWRVLRGWFSRNLHYLTSFAAGIFLLVALDLSGEVLGELPGTFAITLIVIGTLAFWLVDKLIPDAHHHHEPGNGHGHSRGSGRRILLADGLHNAADGIILATAFSLNTGVGIAVTVGILVHEAIQEISEFFVLRDVGYTTKQALVRNFGTSAAILVGVALGTLLTAANAVEPIILAVAAGGFFHVVFADLLPHSLKVCSSRFCIAIHLVWALVGLLVMLGVNFASDKLFGDHNDIHIQDHIAVAKVEE